MKGYETLAPGVEYYPDSGTLLLIRCPKCGRGNWAANVSKGICTCCGYDAHELLKENESEIDETRML